MERSIPFLSESGRLAFRSVLWLLVCLLPCGCADRTTTADRLVLITIDTLRADHLGCYGYAPAATPALDALAAESLLFERAWTPYPLTLPSHASMLTGQLPFAHGLRNNDIIRRGDAEPMLQELLADRGLRTAAVVAAFVLDGSFGLSRGFQSYVDDFPAEVPQERRADYVTNIALQLLDDLGDGPFFLWVHYFDPHAPYGTGAATPIAGYDQEIAFVDTQVARLLDALKAKGFYDAAAIAVVGDHGEAFGEHGEYEHGFFIYDVTLRVPLFLKLPQGRQAGSRRQEDVCVTDLFPTLLHLAGVKPPERAHALNLLKKHGGERLVYAETLSPYVNHGAAPLASARRGRWKYIEAPQAELYDTGLDAAETENRCADLPERAADLRSDLAALNDLAWISSLDPFGQVTTDAATRERLASLGYVSGAGRPAAGRRPDPKEVLAAKAEIDRGDRAAYHGRSAEAEAAYRAALAKMPGDWKAAWKLGGLLEERKDIPGAVQVYRDFLEAAPGNLNARMRLAHCLLEQGRPADALVQLDICRQGAPDYAPVYLARARALQHLGRLDEARAALETLLSSDPDHAEARQLLLQIEGR